VTHAFEIEGIIQHFETKQAEGEEVCSVIQEDKINFSICFNLD
jgi:hypothetical protein